MKPLTCQDVEWLESRIGKHLWTDEDRRRIISDLRAARLADWHNPTSDPAWLAAAKELRSTVRGLCLEDK